MCLDGPDGTLKAGQGKELKLYNQMDGARSSQLDEKILSEQVETGRKVGDKRSDPADYSNEKLGVGRAWSDLRIPVQSLCKRRGEEELRDRMRYSHFEGCKARMTPNLQVRVLLVDANVSK